MLKTSGISSDQPFLRRLDRRSLAWDDSASRYISERLDPARQWCRRRARWALTSFSLLWAFAALGCGLLIVLTNLHLISSTSSENEPAIQTAVSYVSVLVLGTIICEIIFNRRGLWESFHSKEEILTCERAMFDLRTGSYQGLSEEEAFRRLFDRVEDIIASDNAVTLRMLTALEAAAYQRRREAYLLQAPHDARSDRMLAHGGNERAALVTSL
jgi:hypothetical protein